eukprot:SAG22_NODE_64_length_23238_cov_83.185566_12_plen_283_part_00
MLKLRQLSYLGNLITLEATATGWSVLLEEAGQPQGLSDLPVAKLEIVTQPHSAAPSPLRHDGVPIRFASGQSACIRKVVSTAGVKLDDEDREHAAPPPGPTAKRVGVGAMKSDDSDADPVQAHVDTVHAKSAALRRQLLTAWTFEADATPSPGYYSTFAAAPIQHIIAAMALNENQTAVALAQTALANPNMSSHFGAVYEWTCVARAFAMFNSKSSWKDAATMHASTEESMKNMSFNYAVKMGGADKFCAGIPPAKGGGSMCTSGSENLDYDAKSSAYIALR